MISRKKRKNTVIFRAFIARKAHAFKADLKTKHNSTIMLKQDDSKGKNKEIRGYFVVIPLRNNLSALSDVNSVRS